MACVTLKRPLDWDCGNVPAGTTSNNISPRAAKRRCSNVHYTASPPKETSPFGEVNPKLTAEEITANIKDEMKRLQHRKQLHFGSSAVTQTSGLALPLTLTLPPSPPSAMQLQDCLASGSQMHSPSKREQPLFTFRQVGLICERLIRERETQIRDEYDKVLGNKLAEQYDTFVKFTYEQIQKRFELNSTPSYLS